MRTLAKGQSRSAAGLVDASTSRHPHRAPGTGRVALRRGSRRAAWCHPSAHRVPRPRVGARDTRWVHPTKTSRAQPERTRGAPEGCRSVTQPTSDEGQLESSQPSCRYHPETPRRAQRRCRCAPSEGLGQRSAKAADTTRVRTALPRRCRGGQTGRMAWTCAYGGSERLRTRPGRGARNWASETARPR